MFKLCNKNEFAAKCLFYYFKVFGGIPITLDTTFLKSNGNRIWMFSASRVGIIYNIFLFILILVTNSISIINQYSSDFMNRIVFERVTDVMADVFTLFTSLSIVATFLIQRDRFLSIINRLSKANRLLITIDRTTYNEQNKLPSTLSKIFVSNTLIWLVMIFSSPAYDITAALHFFSSYMVINIIDSFALQYSVNLKVLQLLFKVVNENLSNYARESKWNLYSAPRIDRLMRLRKLHMSLSKLAQNLSDFYSAPILLCVADSFIVLTLISNYFIKPLVIGKNELPFPIFFHVLGYGMVFAMQLVVLTKCVGATIAEVNFWRYY